MTLLPDVSQTTEAAEYQRTVRELERVKYGDSLTRFDPPLQWDVIFEAARRDAVNLVGYELHTVGHERVLVGHVNEGGSIGTVFSDPRAIVAARKAWM